LIRVLLVDDESLVRAGLRALLEREDDMDVVGEAADGVDALALARRERPDVIVMDVSMPKLDGLEATRRIAVDSELPEVKVLVLTTFATDEHVFEALRSGASGFLLKDTEPADLLRAVRVIARGEALLSPSLMLRVIEEFVSWPQPTHVIPAQLEWLTEREREVLRLVAAGLSNDDIAGRLVISRATARTHVSRAMRKLHAHDRAQLVVIAYESGLVSPGHVVGAGPRRDGPLAANRH
jgi:DNA-binding NarL/FixJ family response regulator